MGVLLQTGGKFTLESGTIETSTASSVVKVQMNSQFIMNGGTINQKKTNSDKEQSYAVSANCFGTPGAKVTINGGTLNNNTSGGYGVVAINGAKFEMNGGTITSKSFALCNNGSSDQAATEFTINGGKLVSTGAAAIYHPGIDGVLNISGTTEIIGEDAGVEIRAGSLNLSGGTITALKVPTESNANGNGSTTIGAGIAIVQHTTKKSIAVTVSGGTINAYTPIWETNAQNNSDEDLKKITISVTGGTLNATGTTENGDNAQYAVYVSDAAVNCTLDNGATYNGKKFVATSTAQTEP